MPLSDIVAKLALKTDVPSRCVTLLEPLVTAAAMALPSYSAVPIFGSDVNGAAARPSPGAAKAPTIGCPVLSSVPSQMP
jgi:hypothetical protein